MKLTTRSEYASPEHAEIQDRPAMVFARPHDIEISSQRLEGFLAAGVVRIHVAGPVVRLELACEGVGAPVQVECSLERHRQLALSVGEPVYFKLRPLRIFLSEASMS